MTLDEIYVHDAILRAVHEDATAQTMTLDIDLPQDEWSDNLVPKRIVLREVYGYEVHDGPFFGPPAILEIEKVGDADRWTRYRIGTNNGDRFIWTSGFTIEDRK